MNEVQSVACTCEHPCSGEIIVGMFQGQSGPIAHNATQQDIEDALREAITIPDVTVTLINGTQLCSETGSAALINFTHTPGDLPLLRVVHNTLPSSAEVVVEEGVLI